MSRVIPEPSRLLQGYLFHLYLGLLHSLPAKTNLAFSWGRYEMAGGAGKKNQSKFVASFPEKVYEHPHPECALACS